MPPARADNFHAVIVIYDNDRQAGAALGRLGAIALPNVRLIVAAPASEAGGVFRQAAALGCRHIIAISAWANFSADYVAPLILASAENPHALVMAHGSAPGTSACPFTRFSNLLLRLETGHRLRRDGGPRVYPVRLIQTIDPAGERRFCEWEILVRSVWAGCPIVNVALPPASREADRLVPHSISLRQELRELRMHVRLMCRVLGGLPNPRYRGAESAAARQPFWPMFWRWLNPFDAWRELRKGGASRNEMAVGLAVGAFIGNMPAWGFHTVISLYVARRLHLNPLAVMTGSHASAPPMGPVLVASAMWTGHVILHRARPKWENITPFHGKFWENAGPLLLDWTLGAVIIGSALAILVYLAANFLFRFVEKRSDETAPLVIEVGSHS